MLNKLFIVNIFVLMYNVNVQAIDFSALLYSFMMHFKSLVKVLTDLCNHKVFQLILEIDFVPI